jgi:hypothetical protein
VRGFDGSLQLPPIVSGVHRNGSEQSFGSLGAYGLVLTGLDGAHAFMRPQANDAPVFRVQVEVDTLHEGPSILTRESADIRLIGGGRLRLERGRDEAVYFLTDRPTDEELLHPYLAPAAALRWQWSGREALHAGAVGVGSGAILLLGAKESGKSTTLSWLATVGQAAVLTDDLAVMDGMEVMAGPRSIDLRIDPGGASPRGQVVRRGERDRLQVAGGPSTLPVIGLAVLEWGDDLGFTSIPFADRLDVIARNRTFPQVPADPLAMFDLASVPMIRASRPKDMGRLGEFGQRLLDYFA